MSASSPPALSAVKDPELLKTALLPRAPWLSGLEAFGLVATCGPFAALSLLWLSLAFQGLSTASVTLGSLAGLGLSLIAGTTTWAGLMLGLTGLSRRRDEALDPDPTRAPARRERVAGVAHQLATYGLVSSFAMAAAAGLMFSWFPRGGLGDWLLLGLIGLQGSGLVLTAWRCTEAGSERLARIRRLGLRPRVLRIGVATPLAVAVLTTLLAGGVGPVSLLAHLLGASLVILFLGLGLFTAVSREPVRESTLVRLARKPRPLVWEGVLAEGYRLSLLFAALLCLTGVPYLTAFWVPVAVLGILLYRVRPPGLGDALRLPASPAAQRARLDSGGVLCPYCASPLSPEEAVGCRRCETPHHAECWEEFGRCTTYGCEEERPIQLSEPAAR